MSVVQRALTKISTILGINTKAASSTLEALLEAREAQRVAQVRKFRDYYDGNAIEYQTQEGDLPYMNICYSAIEKSVAWLVGSEPIVRARDDIQPVIDEIYQEVYENSGGHSLYREGVVEGSVTGDCHLQVAFEPRANYGRGGFVIRVLDSERTFVEYLNIGQRKELNRVMIIWDQLNEQGQTKTHIELWSRDYVQVWPPGPVASATVGGVELESANQIEFDLYMDESSDDAGVRVDDRGNEYVTYVNPYGELPFVHIPNIKVPHSVHGRSDLHDLWLINREYNEQLLSYKDNVDYHGNPLTLIFGASAKDVERGADKIWSNLPSEAKVENLEVTQTHEAILKYMDLLEKGIGHSAIPTYLLSTENPVQAETSAVAMRLAFLPLVELTDRKKITYGPGFAQAFEKAIKYTNDYFELGLDALDEVSPMTEQKLEELAGILNESQLEKIRSMRMVPYWKLALEFVDHLPRNRSLELTDIILELQNNLEDLPGAMKRLGVKNVEEKLASLIENTEFVAELEAIKQAATMQSEAPPNGDGSKNPPDGQQTSNDAEANKGGQGKKKSRKSAQQVEQETGQSTERTSSQRVAKGKGDR